VAQLPPVRNNEADQQLEIEIDGQVAFAQYRLTEDHVAFIHTVVPEPLEGRGLGSALVTAGMAWAKEMELLVVPRCEFFAAYIAKHPQYLAQVVPEWRARVTR
jgi:uncharacterized protein